MVKKSGKSKRKHEWQSLYNEKTGAKSLIHQREALENLPSLDHLSFFKNVLDTCEEPPEFMNRLVDLNNEVHRDRIKVMQEWATKHLAALQVSIHAAD